MKIKQKIVSIATSLAVVLGVMALPAIITADLASAATCAGVETSIIPDCPDNGTTIQDTGLWSLLLIAINVLTALVGVAVLGGIIYGAVLYTTAQGDQGKVEKAIEVIRNVVIGFVAYALMFAGLNFLIPGGVF
jgi:hypothetical protein